MNIKNTNNKPEEEYEDKVVSTDEEGKNINKYWDNCNSDCRKIALAWNVCNCLFQLNGIINPIEGSDQLIVNILYTLLSLIIFVIIYLSYKEKYGIKFCYHSLILIIFRNIFRLLDFENTKTFMSGFGWRRLCVFQASINCSMISITAICFANVKYNGIVMITCAIFTYICTCYGI